MASAQDILNAITASNGKLDQLHTDLLAGTNATKAVRDAVLDTEAHLDAGFTVLAQGQAVLAGLQVQTNAVLTHLSAQVDTMICLLDSIARNTCALLNDSARQTPALERMRTDLDALVFLYSTVNPGSALELERSTAVAARMDACCPPQQPEPPCRFSGCEAPERLPGHDVDATVPAYPYPPKRPDREPR